MTLRLPSRTEQRPCATAARKLPTPASTKAWWAASGASSIARVARSCRSKILPERGEKLHQPPDGKVSRAITHDRGNVRLLDTKDFSDPRLREAAVLYDLVDLQCQASLQQ